MTITCAIDAIGIDPDGRIAVKGWASSDASGDRQPVDTILLRGIDRAELRFFSRPDFGPSPNRFGFCLYLENRIDLARLRDGEAMAFAVVQRERQPVQIWSALDAQLARMLADDAEPVASNVEASPKLQSDQTQLLPSPGETASFDIEVGSITSDRSVVVGRDGHLFLIGGSNDVEQLYATGEPVEFIGAWLHVTRERAKRFSERGIQFAQMIVPEKQSVLPHAFPAPLSTPSPVLRGIASTLEGEPWFIDSLGCFRTAVTQQGFDPYRRIDTHFTFAGARALWRTIIHHLTGVLPNLEHPPLAAGHRSGDLGDKIGKIMEALLWPVVEDWPFAQTQVEVGRVIDPSGGGHVGCVREWRCATPSINRTLLVFGNSVFGRDIDPTALCWWAARTFRRTIFCWSAAVDWAMVEVEQPDIVICQTIERFLREVPAT